MPLINADFKQLEWLGAVYLSGDVTGYDEILRGMDAHSLNQKRFHLPERLHAKTFLFRLIYGGGAYSYANDALFAHVSTKEAFWQGVIEEAYKKYWGLKLWHDELVLTAMRYGRITIPTGRSFTYSPLKNYKGELKWPRTTILNYPVQGFGADLMVLARILLTELLKPYFALGVLQLGTVHDSILLDVPAQYVAEVVEIIFKAWEQIPNLFKEKFGQELDLPTKVEVKVGPNWKDMSEWEMNNNKPRPICKD